MQDPTANHADSLFPRQGRKLESLQRSAGEAQQIFREKSAATSKAFERQSRQLQPNPVALPPQVATIPFAHANRLRRFASLRSDRGARTATNSATNPPPRRSTAVNSSPSLMPTVRTSPVWTRSNLAVVREPGESASCRRAVRRQRPMGLALAVMWFFTAVHRAG